MPDRWSSIAAFICLQSLPALSYTKRDEGTLLTSATSSLDLLCTKYMPCKYVHCIYLSYKQTESLMVVHAAFSPSFHVTGGAVLQRSFVYSRFRLCHTIRDEGILLTSATFLSGFDVLVCGSGLGELRHYDAYMGDILESVDAHSAPIHMLQVGV